MRDFIIDLAIGVIIGVSALGMLAHVVVNENDNLCEKQGWVGEACQCRILDKNWEKP